MTFSFVCCQGAGDSNKRTNGAPSSGNGSSKRFRELGIGLDEIKTKASRSNNVTIHCAITISILQSVLTALSVLMETQESNIKDLTL